MRLIPAAFTLIELLVVVTIIVVLLALLTPALDRAILRAELATCAARHDGLVNIYAGYAAGQRRKFPLPKTDYEHPIFVPHDFVRIVEQYSGNNKKPTIDNGEVKVGNVPEMLVDPAFKDFGYRDANRYVIGFGYLGQHPALTSANAGFKSPMGLSDLGTGELSVCLNVWSVGAVPPVASVTYGAYTISAHTVNGPTGKLENHNSSQSYFDYNTPTAGTDPKENHGALGGNLGRADGSVAWKDIEEMELRYAGAGPGQTPGTPNYNPGYW